MCGIAGFIDATGKLDKDVLVRMTDVLEHRGPDASGYQLFNEGSLSVGLGHRRLSIIDLSEHGAQPMTSACGRYTISFNGEVFNFKILRKELEAEGTVFKGHSDTEVMLAAFSKWGIEEAVKKFIGMFAFAVWDKTLRKLILVRDRIGIKPIYYGWVGKSFVFASQPGSFRQHPDFANSIDRDALALFFRYLYIPAPYSIYQQIRKLEPGAILTVDCSGTIAEALQNPTKDFFWSTDQTWTKGTFESMHDPEEAASSLESLLKDSVSMRMISDVPLGAFLSGGIDSTLVVALMQSLSSQKIKTFTIGHYQREYNEAKYAKNIAARLGTNHTELYVTQQDLTDTIPQLAGIWDEPFADSSQIPTFLVSRMARRSVTVCLSGDGGDELFAGYDRYLAGKKWAILQTVPCAIRNPATRIAAGLCQAAYGLLGSMAALKTSWRMEFMGSRSFLDRYKFLMSTYKHPAQFVTGGTEPELNWYHASFPRPDELVKQMQLWDLLSYLPDDILTKVDRASMAVSLEVRVPFLDHRVVEFAARIPTEMNMKQNQGKQLLRHILRKYVPDELTDRPKMGFGVPVERWLKNELRDWVESLLDERLLREQEYLDAGMVRSMWRSYVQGDVNWTRYLWGIVMFQAWLARQKTK